MFLSNLSRYRKDQLSGNLNELINGRPKQINTNIASHSIAALSKTKMNSTTKKKISITPKTNNTKRDRQKSFTFDKTVNVNSKRKINRRVHYNIQKKKTPIAAPTSIPTPTQIQTKKRSKTSADEQFKDNPTGYGSPIPLKIKKKNSAQITKNKKNNLKSVQKRKDANANSIKKVSV